MFGMGFGEFAVVLLLALVIFGPKELPKYLRKAGQFVGQLRNWANDMRRKSGIDEVLRLEGLERDIAEIRKLTRGELTGILGSVRAAASAMSFPETPASIYTPPPLQLPPAPAPVEINREREYPRDGADAYGALPDAAVVDEPVVPSPWAADALYARGEDDPVPAAPAAAAGAARLPAGPEPLRVTGMKAAT